DIWKFLSGHPNIRYWVASDPFLRYISSIPRGVLPNVSDVILVRPNITKYLVDRPIQRLVWVFQSVCHTRSDGIEAIAPLELCKHTLTHIHYTYLGQQDPDWTT